MGATPGDPTTLRPLGLGELLDRAVTLCVRHFWALGAIYVGFAALLELLQFLGGNDRAHLLAALTDLMKNQSGGKSSSEVLKTLAQYPAGGGWSIAVLVLAFFGLPLPLGAMAASASAFYLGGSVSIGEAYRVALRSWVSLILVSVCYVVAGALAYLGLVLLLVVVAFSASLLFAAFGAALGAFKGVAIALGILFLVVLVLACVLAAIVVTLAYDVSFYTCALERVDFWTAFTKGLRRVFVGVGVRRSLLVGLAYYAIAIGIAIISGIGQGVLLGLFKSAALSSIFAVIVNVAEGAFSTVFLILFYYDLRVREEGLDLQLAARAMPAEAFPAN